MAQKEIVLVFDKDTKDNERTFEIVKEILDENTCRITKQVWQSKYNSYVVYDYKPFCSNGFNVSLHCMGEEHILDYASWLIAKRLEDHRHLEACGAFDCCFIDSNLHNDLQRK